MNQRVSGGTLYEHPVLEHVRLVFSMPIRLPIPYEANTILPDRIRNGRWETLCMSFCAHHKSWDKMDATVTAGCNENSRQEAVVDTTQSRATHISQY